jgi:hypothetical protein
METGAISPLSFHLSLIIFQFILFHQKLKKLVAWKLRSTISSLTKDKPISEVIDGVPFDKRYGPLFHSIVSIVC